MHLLIAKKHLYDALHTVSRAVASRTTLPILGHVLMEAQQDRLVLTTTDLELGMTCVIPVDVMAPGAVTVPQRILQDVVSNLPDGEIALRADERNLLALSSRKSNYTIHGLPAEEYPAVAAVTSEMTLTLPAPVLRELIRKVLFAASHDEARQVLTGCLFQHDGHRITMVATDTHRLAIRQMPLPASATSPFHAILPARALQEVLRVLGGSDDEVTIIITDRQAQFEIGRTCILTRLIEGQFPAYERVIPKEHDKSLGINRQAFYEAIRRASIVARTESNKVILRCQDGVLAISAETGDIGKAYEELPVQQEGDAVEIAFNAEYLQEALPVMESDVIALALSGPLNPGLITGSDDPDFRYVAMPMQIL